MNSRKGFTLIELLTVVITILMLFWIIVGGFGGFFVEENVAVKSLEQAGYEDVKVINRAVFFLSFRGGSRSDSVRFTCSAKNPAGQEVETYVFAGWLFKAPTPRAKID